VRIIAFAPHMTHVFRVLDVVLFDALKKRATCLETLNEEQPAAAFLLRVYYDFKRTMVEVNIWEPPQRCGSLTTLSRIFMDCSSMRRGSDKVRASWSDGSPISHWRICRSVGEKQSLDGSINQIKSISFIFHIFLMFRNKDMPSTIYPKK
jgi:hypothetical protein